MGKVFLVGAGCGDLDLYTVKAMRCIQNADCLVYDALIDDAILKACKEDCEKIYVGKHAHHHALPQEEICQLLVEKSKVYETVIRLKGGDVYVFGRGGEEGQVLAENGVDFEVVPGVSSCMAGLAYAGIPITHRGLSGGFQVYTASLKHNEERHFDFTRMLDDYCTYVFLMGMSKLEMIVKGFLEAGKKPTTPVAIVSNATLPHQESLEGTLETILSVFKAHPLPTPGIIVVGEVVKMRAYLNFYENKPLFHQRILVTTIGEDHELRDKLKVLGANVNEVMVGKITYEDCNIPELSGYLVFTSKHGVIGFMKNFLKQYGDLRKLSHLKIVSIGKKTSDALKNYGLIPDFEPSQADSDYLNEELAKIVGNEKVFLARGHLPVGFNLDREEFFVYKNSEVEISQQIEHYHYGFFTSASSVERFKNANQSTFDCFVSIGKHTSRAIRACYGENVKIIEVTEASKDAMVKMILKGE